MSQIVQIGHSVWQEATLLRRLYGCTLCCLTAMSWIGTESAPSVPAGVSGAAGSKLWGQEASGRFSDVVSALFVSGGQSNCEVDAGASLFR